MKTYSKNDLLGYVGMAVFIGFVIGVIITGTIYSQWTIKDYRPTLEEHFEAKGWVTARIVEGIPKQPCREFSRENYCSLYLLEILSGKNAGEVERYVHSFPSIVFYDRSTVLVKTDSVGRISDIRFNNEVIP